jgi:hypothetical protein
MYHIHVTRLPAGADAVMVMVDGVNQENKAITLIDDIQEHQVEVQIPLSLS